MAKKRGYKINRDQDNILVITGTSIPVSKIRALPCGYCGLMNTKKGYDGCIGGLKYPVKNACCGHGNTDKAYIQFDSGDCIRGDKAVKYQNNPKNKVI